MITDILKKEIPVTRISRAMDIQRSTIYYTGSHGKRLPRISQEIEEQALKIAGERITYGYRRIWALMRNSGIHVNIKTVRRIMRRNSLSLPYAKHKNRTGKKDLTIPVDINTLWETDIHYVSTVHEEWHISCQSKTVSARNGYPMYSQEHALQTIALKL